MQIREIMTTSVVTVTMDHTLEQVKEVFEAEGFHHPAVVASAEEGAEVVGLVSDRDMLRTLSPFVGKMAERNSDLHTLDRPVHQWMVRDIVSVGPDESAAWAARLMLRRGVSCLPVVEGGHLVGIVTLRDVAFLAIDLLEAEPGENGRVDDAA